MFQTSLRLKLTKRVKGSCPVHPRYNPASSGEGGIIGNCTKCSELFDLFRAFKTVEAALRNLDLKAEPWLGQKKHRPAKPSSPARQDVAA